MCIIFFGFTAGILFSQLEKELFDDYVDVWYEVHAVADYVIVMKPIEMAFYESFSWGLWSAWAAGDLAGDEKPMTEDILDEGSAVEQHD